MSTTAQACLVIRADASPTLGLGHVVRSLVLARQWRDSGGYPVLLTRWDEPRGRALAEGAGIPWRVLPGGCDTAQACLQCCEEMGVQHSARSPSWVVLDVPQLSRERVHEWQALGFRVAVIEDAPSAGGAAAQVLINPNPRVGDEGLKLLQTRQRQLLGTDFVMLHAPVGASARTNRFCAEPAQHVLISMGAADPMHLTETVLALLRQHVNTDVEVQVVAGPLFARERVAALAHSLDSRTVLLAAPESLQTAIEWADVAILCGGNTLWEACFAGCPVASFAHNELQARILRRMDGDGELLFLGCATDLDVSAAARRLQSMLISTGLRRSLSRRAQQLIDGRGAERVVAELRRSAV